MDKPFIFTDPYGTECVTIESLVKYLHAEIKISDTNRKHFEEEVKHLDRDSNEWKWQAIEAMKSEAEVNVFINILQALGKNPIKESK
jgi:transposase